MIVKINTHPIVAETHEEYNIDWCGRIIDTRPIIRNGKPVFFITGSAGCTELNTTDMKRIEKVAKSFAKPRGRGAIITDKSYIYIMEEKDKKTLLGIVTHNHIREYRRIFDEFDFI